MLVLSTHKNERIVIVKEGKVILTFTHVKGSKDAKIGFEASREYQIYREKVWDAKQRDKQETTESVLRPTPLGDPGAIQEGGHLPS